MRTKLQVLFFIGIIILLLPILYFPPIIHSAITITCGIVVLYIVWRIRAHYKKLMLKVRRYEDSPIIE